MPGRRSSARQSTAVMANRAPAAFQDGDPQVALWRALDFFPTPPWAARAGGELIRKLDPKARTLWEPACGVGHMAQPLREMDDHWDVLASDIHDHGFGLVHDFLGATNPPAWPVDWVITNPPFKLGAEFVRRGLEVAERGVALLLRLSFLESVGRYPLLFGVGGLTAVAPFAERVCMTLGRWEPDGDTATAYAWFVWMKPKARFDARSPLEPMLVGIPPGTAQRLTRPDDAARFGVARPGSLL